MNSSTAFLDLFRPQGRKFCYVLVSVPILPKFDFYWFQSLDAKIAANQERFNERAHRGFYSFTKFKLAEFF